MKVYGAMNAQIQIFLVVKFMPRPLYDRGKSPQYPLDRLGGPQSRSGRHG
jgi:hypothetical protein